MAKKNYKTFVFNWYKNEKYGQPIVCNNTIVATSAKAATGLFMQAFGNLKKNTINYIQEINPDTKENIGEPIIPDNDNDTIPAVKVTSVEKKVTK